MRGERPSFTVVGMSLGPTFLENIIDTPIKLGIELLYEPAVPFWSIYLGAQKTQFRKVICIPIFTAAIFATAQVWKQPECPRSGDWIMKLW